MDEFAAGLRRERAAAMLSPLFFVSGATALVYQTLWNRELHLVFGTSSFAIATVLSAFMAGLAIGGALMGRVADRIERPLRIYGLLEIGIGLYALLLPTLVDLITPLYLYLWQVLQPPVVVFGILQFVIVGLLLVLPTAAMGATLPLLARFATLRLGSAGDRIGTLYAVNTAGAVIGTWLAGFVLLPSQGRWTTTVLAALANVVLGLGAIVLDRWQGHGLGARTSTAEIPGNRRWLGVAVVLGIGGFSSLIYEVAWTRVLALMVGASVYGFSLMLLAFLIGIAIGGKLGGPLADRLYARNGGAGVLAALVVVEAGIALTSYGLMYVFPELPFWYVWMFDAMGAASDPRGMWVTSLLLAGVIMTPPAVLMGMAFPLAVRAAVGDEEALGAPVGWIYSANTIGGVFGAFVAGFILLPGPGVQWTLLIGALGNLLAAGIAGWLARSGSSRPWWAVGPSVAAALCMAFVLVRPPWDPMLMTSGMYHYVSSFEDHSREGIERYAAGLYGLVFYEEGLSSVVTVAKNHESGNLWLANNGKVDASTSTDMPTQLLCSLLPLQFAETREEVLVIGLASGITAGALTTVPDIERLEIVELEPAIRRAARFFDDHNHAVLDDPRVELIGNDGRNHLLMQPESSYDVIVSEPSNPWITGVSNLFTEEFWRMGKRRLKPGGVWSQWVQMYGMDDQDLKSLLRTFATVYPHVLVYATIQDADLVLIGSDEPLVPDEAHAEVLFRDPTVVAELKRAGVEKPFDIIAMLQLDRATIMDGTANAPLNTDDNMRIEYNAPLNLHRDTNDENMRLLLDNAGLPNAAMRSSDDWVQLARAYWRREDQARGLLAYREAILASAPGDERSAIQAEAKDRLVEVEAGLEK